MALPIKFIFDLDGTLALNDHRNHYLEKEPKDWDGFFKACVDDEPNLPILTLLADLIYVYGVDLVRIWSGRSQDVHSESVDWIQAMLSRVGCCLSHDEIDRMLQMRPSGDFTPDDQLKMFWLSEIDRKELIAVFDDRDKVVKMWRDNGVTCLQVAPGSF